MPNTCRNGLAAILVALAAGCGEPLEQPAQFTADLVLAPTIQAAAPIPRIDQARIRIGRVSAERVLDTTVTFPTDASQLSLRLQVALAARSERLGVTVDLLSGGQVYFSGTDTVVVVALGTGPAATARLVLRYVGPGANIRTLRIGPRDSTLAFGDPLTFRITGSDAQGAPVTNFPVTWSTTDAQVPISQAGVILSPPRRVTIRVAAIIPTGVADTVALTFVPKPVAIGLISGAGQTGRPFAALPVPFAVVVKAADSLPMAGVAVRFRPLTSGGLLRDTTVLTNSQGQAATTILLGGSVGVFSYDATVTGIPAVALTAIATAGPAARVLYQSGGAQVARVNTPQAQPLGVLVTDSNGFPVSGEKVSWSVVAGGGQVAATSSSSDAQGIATITTTTGTLQGVSLIRATIAGPTSPPTVTFASFGTAGPTTSLQIFNGNGLPPFFPATLTVRQSDAFGNPVPSVNVTWAITVGTGTLSAAATTSGTDGLAAVGYTPNNQNDVAILATIPGGQSVTFSLPANQNPTGFVPKSGGGQTGIVTQTLANPAVARLSDLGTSVSGATVTWQILEGGGSLSATSSVTDTSGSAGVFYTAGTKAGTARIQARDPASGLVANFSFLIGPSQPTQLVAAAGDNQSAVAGTVPPLSLRVLLVDGNNNPVPGVVVGWAALDGGSTAAPSVSDQFGVAATTVRLGPTPGPQRFRATAGTLAPLTFIVTAR